jgi:hypothetical protein
MSAIWALSSFQARYQGITDQMNDWDTQRISENLNIRSVDNTTLVETFGTHALNYNFSITVDGNGGETVNIVRIYVYNQSAPASALSKRLWIYNPINASAQPRSGFNHSIVNTGEVAHVIAVNGTKFRGSFQYRIILTTDRGRQFSYSYPPPAGQGGGGGYAVVLADDQYNFVYKATGVPNWRSAYSKPVGTSNTLYRILIKNTTNNSIILQSNSSMLQMAGKVGQVQRRYIVSNQSTVSSLVAFTSQTINSGAEQFVYFAATAENGATFQGEPGKSEWLVTYMMIFKYSGDPEYRSIGFPALAQELT